jgi:hypothetical protein
VSYSQFTGTIPAEIGLLTNLGTYVASSIVSVHYGRLEFSYPTWLFRPYSLAFRTFSLFVHSDET